MAVPKSKVSKQRSNKRAANWKLTAPNLSECPQCHALKASHTVCGECGYYKGKLVVEPKKESGEK
ncbi:MAG: 50S ribosomal protein L32 [Christensenellales bacterium]|jgi:large subunit ribosomal protein L32